MSLFRIAALSRSAAVQMPALRAAFVRSASVGATMGPRSVVVTAAGPDRKGIVSDLSKQLKKHGANVEESRMTILGNDFAMIFLVTLPPKGTTPDELKRSLEDLFPEFIVAARDTSVVQSSPGGSKIVRINMSGPDQPGMVAALSEHLAGFDASIRDLDTDTSSAPFAGYQIFSLKAIVALPTHVSSKELRHKMQELESDLGVDISIESVDAGKHK
eukprot:Opistho-2@36893